MNQLVEFGAGDSVAVECRDDEVIVIIFGSEPGLRLFGDRHELHAFIIEADRQLVLLNGGMFSRRSRY